MTIDILAEKFPALRALLHRPLVCAAAGLVLGLMGGKAFGFGFSPDFGWLAAAAGLLLALKLVTLNRALTASLLFFVSGLLGGWLRVQTVREALHAPPARTLAVHWIEGRVVEDKGNRLESGKSVLILDRVNLIDLKDSSHQVTGFNGKVRVSFNSVKNEPYFGPGDRIGFPGTLYFSHPPTNIGEFDYRSYLLGRDIQAGASPHYKSRPGLLYYEGGMPIRRMAWQAQRRLAEALDRHLPPRQAAFARGAVLGDKGGLERRDQKAFTKSGLAYLLAVSGLHLGISLLLFMFIATRVTSDRRKQALISLCLVGIYAMITGLQVPVQRAACLYFLALAARALDLETDFAVSLAFGALLVLAVQPGALWEAGFQLSFLVTASIVYVGAPLAGKLKGAGLPRWLAAFLGVVWSAQVAVIPLAAYHFHQFTWPALISDGSVAPFMPVILALGLLVGVFDLFIPWLAAILAHPLQWSLWWLEHANAYFATLPNSVISTGLPAWWVLLGWIFFALWLTGRGLSSVRGRFASLIVLLLLVALTLWPAMPFNHLHPGITRVWFMDVGQGDATLIEFDDGKTLLIDTGTNQPDAGSWVVEPALRALGISAVDWVALSHPHADHMGGLLWLSEQVPIGSVYHSGFGHDGGLWGQVKNSVVAAGSRLQALKRGNEPEGWKGKIKILSPGLKPLEGTKHEMHDNGLSLLIGDWLLMTGDMGKEGERDLLKRGLVPDVEVYKVAHHGSRSSTSYEFLQKAKPEVAVAMTGRRYRYGHPHSQVLSALNNAGVNLYRTDLHGSVAMQKSSTGLSVEPWMQVKDELRWKPGPKLKRAGWKKLEPLIQSTRLNRSR